MSRDFERDSAQYLSNANAIISGTPFTMACWFRSENVANDQTLLSVGVAGSGDQKHALQLVGSAAGDPVRVLSRTTSAGQADTSTGYTAGTWYHACGVWASATDRRAYINGGSEGTNTTSRAPTGMDSTYIGATQGASPVTFSDGFIAEAGIWNVALTTGEIAALAGGVSPLKIRPDALVAYWPIYGAYSPEPDMRGGFHMTLNAAPVQANHAPVAPGWVGDLPIFLVPSAAGTKSTTVSLWADLKKTQSTTTTLWSDLLKTQSTTVSLWSDLKKTQNTTVILWANLLKTQSTTVSLWSDLKKTQSTTVTLWANLSNPQSTTVRLWADLKKPQSTTVTLWADLKKQQTTTVVLWTDLKKQQTTTAALWATLTKKFTTVSLWASIGSVATRTTTVSLWANLRDRPNVVVMSGEINAIRSLEGELNVIKTLQGEFK